MKSKPTPAIRPNNSLPDPHLCVCHLLLCHWSFLLSKFLHSPFSQSKWWFLPSNFPTPPFSQSHWWFLLSKFSPSLLSGSFSLNFPPFSHKAIAAPFHQIFYLPFHKEIDGSSIYFLPPQQWISRGAVFRFLFFLRRSTRWGRPPQRATRRTRLVVVIRNPFGFSHGSGAVCAPRECN